MYSRMHGSSEMSVPGWLVQLFVVLDFKSCFILAFTKILPEENLERSWCVVQNFSVGDLVTFVLLVS